MTFMKNTRNLRIAALFLIVAPTPALLAQNAAAPIFAGMQPDLVQGVEDGLAKGKPKVRHVYVATSDTLGLVIDAEAMENRGLVPYKPQPGDTIRRWNEKPTGPDGSTYAWHRQITRGGKVLGMLVGPEDNLFYNPALVREGEALNLKLADSPANYAVTSTDDPAFASPAKAVAVSRKSKPEVREWTGAGVEESIGRHEIFVKFAKPLTPGKRYTLSFPGSSQLTKPVTFTFDDTRLRTEALHVNQVGYHPRQFEKTAFLYLWLGSGGGADFSAFKTFQLVDDSTGKPVFTEKIVERASAVPGKKMPAQRSVATTDALPMATYALDFSAFATPGKYRIVVPGLGTSFKFNIDDRVWDHAARISARGFLLQRAGIAMKPPYSPNFHRPRNMHPADGFAVHETDPAIFNDSSRFSGGGNAFKRIQASILMKTSNPEAWGGWMDAADHDRSIEPQQHTRAVHAFLDLYESNPAFFEKFNLNIPESGNKIPDVLDEALWCMELFRRLQRPDGAIPSAVESIEHPLEPSYALSLPTAITPSTPQTCHLYAAAAAQMSLNLATYDPALAAKYKESAIRAMAWADKNASVANIYNRNDINPAAHHATHAFVWMYRLTEDQTWHERFKKSLSQLYPGDTLRFDTSDYTGPWGLVAYALMPPAQADAALQKKCRDALIAAADKKATTLSGNTLGLGPSVNWEERIGQPWEMIAAHRLTGDARYIKAMQQTAQFGLGNNPNNASYTTGLGTRQVVPFHLESLYLGVASPEGVTTGGPLPRNFWNGAKTEKKLAPHLYPAWENWPWAESNFNIRDSVVNEHIIAGSLANMLLLRAYIAQDFNRP